MAKKTNKKWIFMIAVLAVVVLLAFMNYLTQSSEKREEDRIASIMAEITPDRFPMTGNINSPIKVVEFGDYKCPPCGRWAQEVYEPLKSEYMDTGKIQFYYVQFPFLGEDSYTAAYVGESIYHQNAHAFWDYYRLIHKNQGKPSEVWATEEFLAGLIDSGVNDVDIDVVLSELAEGVHENAIVDNHDLADRLGVKSTPTLFVNNMKVDGGYEEVKQVIENLLK